MVVVTKCFSMLQNSVVIPVELKNVCLFLSGSTDILLFCYSGLINFVNKQF